MITFIFLLSQNLLGPLCLIVTRLSLRLLYKVTRSRSKCLFWNYLLNIYSGTLFLKFTKFDTVFCWYQKGKKLSLKFRSCASFHGLQKSLFFSLPELKAQVSFSDQNISVVRHCCCCRKLITFFSPPEPVWANFSQNLAKSIHQLMRYRQQQLCCAL